MNHIRMIGKWPFGRSLGVLVASFILLSMGTATAGWAGSNLSPAVKQQADSLHRLGDSLIQSGKFESARGALQAEVTLRDMMHDSLGLASGLNSLSCALKKGAKLKEGLAAGERALAICKRTVGESDTLAARSFTSIGNVYLYLGTYGPALDCFNKALPIWLRVFGPEHPAVAAGYENIGIACWALGDYQQALENHNRTLAIKLKTWGPGHPELASTYGNLGIVYYDLCDFEKALDNDTLALAINLAALGADHPEVAKSYNNIGNVYRELDDYGKALENFNRALAIELKTLAPEHPAAALTYINIGLLYFDRGDYEKALENCNAALTIKLKELGPDHPDVAHCYEVIGSIYGDLGQLEKARENITKALAIWIKAYGPDHRYVAESYNNIGIILCEFGDYQKALENYNRALAIQLKVLGPDHPDVSGAYYDIGKLYRRKKDFVRALDFMKKAISIIEKMRGGFSSQDLRQAYAESVRDRYDGIITLLLELGRPKEAFEYYERSKSKLLQDELNREGVEIGPGEVRKKLDEVKSLGLQVGALEQQVIDEKSKPKPGQNKSKIENLTKLLAKTKGEFYRLVSEIKQNPTFAFAVDVNPVAFASIQKDLPEGTNVVMYYEAKDALYILLVTRDAYLAKSVAVSKDSLDGLVKRFRASIDTTPAESAKTEDAGLKATLTTLHRYLIQPIGEELNRAKEITIIPSGTLYYLPFEALAREDGTNVRYLIEDAPVSYLTSAELLRYVQAKTSKEKGNYDLLLVGNPTGADLPTAEAEVKAISALYPRSRSFVESQATKPVVAAQAPASEILHLATHAYPDSKNPWQSYIYLTRTGEDDGHWTMADVTNETWDNMSLVTLSACETAVGGDKPGLEMESIARAFSIAGAPSIIATLWPVNDTSTKDLMVNFYTNLKSMSKVEALRQAQLSLIRNPKYSHPYFWAPFILIGDWR